jgi:hypothetical protein
LAVNSLLAAALTAYGVGSVPAAAGVADAEFPISGPFRGEVAFIALSQGWFDDKNPFAHLGAVAPWGWLHYDGIPNLRLSAGFQETFNLAIEEVGVPSSQEERFMARARLQQPKGQSAIYETLQLDVRNLDGQVVFRPRFRAGVGFNLDAARVQSLMLYQEVALRFADSSYTTKAFDFYRSVVGYTWTTKRGLFATLALVVQASLAPNGGNVTLLYGAALSLLYRFQTAAKAPAIEETPPQPEVEPP